MTEQIHVKNEAFLTAYKVLNEAQKQAVDTIEGPVMVIAGPGTGKTQILTLRIANILLQTDTAPESVLALTFTESGTKAMRERLYRYIGASAYRVPIYTFHGFAGEMIRRYPEAFPRIMGGRVVGDIEQIALLRDIIDSGEFSLLRPVGSPYYYLRHIRSQISDMKREYVTPDALAYIIQTQEAALHDIPQFHEKGAHKGKVRGEYRDTEKRILKNKELLVAYRLYEAVMKSKKRFDFDDMIIELVKTLEQDEDLLRAIQEQYQYVLADEHQDVNGAQNKILELLCNFHDTPNIFVVGDEKQAIYRFQGASLENFLYFEDLFPNTKTISLTENYRSGQTVLDAAHALVAVTDGPLAALRVPLHAAAVSESQVTERLFTHQSIEDAWVVEEVQAQIAAGVPPEEVAIIVRSNKEVAKFAGLLRKEGISVTASADGDVLDHPITQAVEALINFVLTDTNEAALFSVLHGAYWGIPVNDVVRIMSARSYGRSLLSILSDSALLRELGVVEVEKAQNVVAVLEMARAKEVSEPPHRVLEYILTASGFIAHVTKYDPLEGVRVIRRLYDEVESLVVRDDVGTLTAVSREFGLRREYGLPLSAPYITTNERSVQVMTAHKSKGLEFAVVFVPHIDDASWGGKSHARQFVVPITKHIDESQFDAIDDERRLLYVAMTRAKKKLYLSVSDTNTEGRVLVPSRLVNDLEPWLEHAETASFTTSFDVGAQLRINVSPQGIDTTLVQTILAQRGFSATSLNNYLKNPWNYIYRNVLRIPEVQPTHMQFGTAVHNTLRRVTHMHTAEGKAASMMDVKMWLEAELNRLPLSVVEYTQLLEKGIGILSGYLPHVLAGLPKITYEEKSFSVLFETGVPELPMIPLTGNLDRIDIGDDGFAIRVVDYKTGKPKSRNVIEGKTAHGNGEYKRQLTFYTLLLLLHGDERLMTNTGVLTFVEPKTNGSIAEETFYITDEEVAALREEIQAAVAALVSGVYLNEAVAKESEYAQFAEVLIRQL